jgi:zinc metalloprotease ZmpB
MTEPSMGRNVAIGPNEQVTHLEHLAEPFLSPGMRGVSAEGLADAYLAAVAGTYNFDPAMLGDLEAAPSAGEASTGPQLHRSGVKNTAGSIVVNYSQRFAGLPVWGADFSVHIADAPLRVTSSSSSIHSIDKLENDAGKVEAEYKTLLTPASLGGGLGLAGKGSVIKINGLRPVVYLFDPSQRVERLDAAPKASFEPAIPLPPLPPLPEHLKAGGHYAAVEVFFDLDGPQWPHVHWRAIVEPVAGCVLYLRPLVSGVTGQVFRMDPISLSGNAALIPSAAEADLAPWRSTVAVTELAPAMPQGLTGTQVDLQELKAPVAGEPTTLPPYNFAYPVKTVDFTATNAYYHVNWFFNLIKGMGFNLETYFDGTTFPVPVDHWGLGGTTTVNAHCPGNATGNGIGHFCFAAAQQGQNVGIADDVRVVIHEFGHALLWDHVSSPNFGFAHSAGDALGAILMDPASLAPDRFLTFPWPQTAAGPLDRRHDRPVASGWGWFGSRYDTGYGGEQVLSTSLFRLYRSLGGDSPHLPDRQWAARYTAYLIIKAIGTLTTTTPTPEVFVTALMNADLTTINFEGHRGGTTHKVIRWAFEKQGLYGPNAHPGTATPVTTEGNPPPVDVYIDDGRHGEYGYLHAFWDCQDMWVRRKPDGGTAHQAPAVGRTNYMYVRVKNRGTASAANVRVKAYHCSPGTGLAWPNDWSPMDTPELPAPSAIASGGSVIVGPFAWKPQVFAHECLLAIASASGDPANDTTVTGPVSHARFVPFDNNIGQRNVQPIFVIDWPKWLNCVTKIPLHVVNPYPRTVKVELVAALPKAMSDNRLWVFFDGVGGNKFELGPNQARRVSFSVVNKPRITPRSALPVVATPPKPGIATIEELLDRETGTDSGLNSPMAFRVFALVDGELAGGVTYLVQGKDGQIPDRLPVGAEEDTPEETSPSEPSDVRDIVAAIDAIPGIKSVRLKKLSVDIEFEDE